MSTSNHASWLKIGGACGVITPIITIPLILLAISYSPWFSWTENALSDLGVHEAAVVFNSSLMIGGILTLIFALGLVQILRQTRTGILGTIVLILAAISLFAIGLFPETAGRIHFYVSVSFFTLDILAMLIIGVAFARESSGKRAGALSIAASLFAIGVWIGFWSFPLKGVAIPEMLASIATSTWSAILGIKLFVHASES